MKKKTKKIIVKYVGVISIIVGIVVGILEITDFFSKKDKSLDNQEVSIETKKTHIQEKDLELKKVEQPKVINTINTKNQNKTTFTNTTVNGHIITNPTGTINIKNNKIKNDSIIK